MAAQPNPTITPLLRAVTAVEVGVLFVTGVGLFFLPDLIGRIWPWPLAPFNARFLGAIYLASLAAAFLLVWFNRWSPARLVTPMIFLFTIIVLVTSAAYLDRFDLTSPATWLWFLLYVGLPLNAGYHLWLYRHQPAATSLTLPSAWRAYLLAQALVLGLYSVGLLLAPVAFSAFWPWPLDAFHGRMYSVAFLSAALGALVLYRAAPPAELLTLGLTQLVLGLFPILGLLVVDASTHRVNWSAAGTWLWLAGFALMTIAAVAMLAHYAKRSPGS